MPEGRRLRAEPPALDTCDPFDRRPCEIEIGLQLDIRERLTREIRLRCQGYRLFHIAEQLFDTERNPATAHSLPAR